MTVYKNINITLHTRVKNKNAAPMYLIKDKRCMLKTGFPKDVAKHMNRYPLSGRVLCFKCGRVMQRRHWNHGTKAERVMQQCCGYIEGIKNCDAKAVRNELLEKCSKKVLTENFLLKVDCNKRVNKILNKVLPNETATSSLYELENKKQTLSRELTTLVEMKLKAKHHSEFEVIENKYNNTSNQLDNISKEIQEFEELEQENIKIRERLDKIKDFIDTSTQKVPELDSNVFQNAIFKNSSSR